MNLVLDIGNTRTKVAIFEKKTLLEKAILSDTSFEALTSFLTEKGVADKITAAIVSSTANDNREADILRGVGCRLVRLDYRTPIPIKNNYETPQTLGRDRLAGVIGAQVLFPKENCLVIDAGTCITYDLIDTEGGYFGGNISVGLEMRLKAMHHFTAKLPLVHLDKDLDWRMRDLRGTNTEKALKTGAVFGFLSEIEGFVARYAQMFGDLKVILTGGDAPFLHKNLTLNNVFYAPDVVLIGLNEVLNFE